MTKKNWFKWTVTVTAGILLFIALAMYIYDPYFHYHGPLNGLSYRLYSERYMNDGIAKNFTYNAVITGSSMNQNFKTTEFDDLFETQSIKIPFSGAGFQEIANNLNTALTSRNDVKYVLWGIDYNGLYRAHYWKGYEEYPDYLYDNSIWNDASYVWNKSLLFEGLLIDSLNTLRRIPSTSFDEYSSWDVGSGWEQIKKTYYRSSSVMPMETVTNEEMGIVRDNIYMNIVELVRTYPEVQFILFYTPYSALYWESIVRDGTFEKQLQYEMLTSSMLLEEPNIQLFSFSKETEITSNVNNYRDKEHYIASINSKILQWIKEGKGRLTLGNYEDMVNWEREYYSNFDYDSLYEN